MARNIGDVETVRAAFTNAAGAGADPTTVTLYYKRPGATMTTLIYGTDVEVVRDSAGNYHADLDLDTAGMWLYEWAGTGAAGTLKGNEGGQFRVSARVVRG